MAHSGGGWHYGLWHPANKITKITNFASSGPNGLKIGQRCGDNTQKISAL